MRRPLSDSCIFLDIPESLIHIPILSLRTKYFLYLLRITPDFQEITSPFPPTCPPPFSPGSSSRGRQRNCWSQIADVRPAPEDSQHYSDFRPSRLDHQGQHRRSPATPRPFTLPPDRNRFPRRRPPPSNHTHFHLSQLRPAQLSSPKIDNLEARPPSLNTPPSTGYRHSRPIRSRPPHLQTLRPSQLEGDRDSVPARLRSHSHLPPSKNCIFS